MRAAILLLMLIVALLGCGGTNPSAPTTHLRFFASDAFNGSREDFGPNPHSAVETTNRLDLVAGSDARYLVLEIGGAPIQAGQSFTLGTGVNSLRFGEDVASEFLREWTASGGKVTIVARNGDGVDLRFDAVTLVPNPANPPEAEGTAIVNGTLAGIGVRPGNEKVNLKFSEDLTTNVNLESFSPPNPVEYTPTAGISLTVQDNSGGVPRRLWVFVPEAMPVGRTILLPWGFDGAWVNYTEGEGDTARQYWSTRGRVTLTRRSGNSIEVRLAGVYLAALDNSGATGAFYLDGTIAHP